MQEEKDPGGALVIKPSPAPGIYPLALQDFSSSQRNSSSIFPSKSKLDAKNAWKLKDYLTEETLEVVLM